MRKKLIKLARKKTELKIRDKEITKEIRQKVENADKREFNNPHINRDITFNKTDILFSRFAKEYQEEIENINEEKKEVNQKTIEIIKNNSVEVADKFYFIERIDDIINDITKGTEYDEDAASYFLKKLSEEV